VDIDMNHTLEEVQDIVFQFITLIEGNSQQEVIVICKLNLLLDQLACICSSIANYSDNESSLEAPRKDYKQLREQIESIFPSFGYYNLPASFTKDIAQTQLEVGDAIDDLTDIAIEIYEVAWLWENSSHQSALAQLARTYFLHWQGHLRSLQYYIYSLNIEQ
jgi:Domain of unknown function (DUF5063)